MLRRCRKLDRDLLAQERRGGTNTAAILRYMFVRDIVVVWGGRAKGRDMGVVGIGPAGAELVLLLDCAVVIWCYCIGSSISKCSFSMMRMLEILDASFFLAYAVGRSFARLCHKIETTANVYSTRH